IGCIIGSILMTGFMVKLYKRKSAAVINLCGKHEADFLFCHGRVKMNNTLYILYCITIPVSVTQSCIHKGCRSGPYKCNKALKCVPGIYHYVEFLARSVYLEIGQFTMPVVPEFLKLFLYNA